MAKFNQDLAQQSINQFFDSFNQELLTEFGHIKVLEKDIVAHVQATQVHYNTRSLENKVNPEDGQFINIKPSQIGHDIQDYFDDLSDFHQILMGITSQPNGRCNILYAFMGMSLLSNILSHSPWVKDEFKEQTKSLDLKDLYRYSPSDYTVKLKDMSLEQFGKQYPKQFNHLFSDLYYVGEYANYLDKLKALHATHVLLNHLYLDIVHDLHDVIVETNLTLHSDELVPLNTWLKPDGNTAINNLAKLMGVKKIAREGEYPTFESEYLRLDFSDGDSWVVFKSRKCTLRVKNVDCKDILVFLTELDPTSNPGKPWYRYTDNIRMVLKWLGLNHHNRMHPVREWLAYFLLIRDHIHQLVGDQTNIVNQDTIYTIVNTSAQCRKAYIQFDDYFKAQSYQHSVEDVVELVNKSQFRIL